MKSEPDRLDLLIVALPVILLVVMGIQVVRFVQMSRERGPGIQLAQEVIAREATPPAETPGDDAPPAAPTEAGEDAAASGEAVGTGEPGAPAEDVGEEGAMAPGPDGEPGAEAGPGEDASGTEMGQGGEAGPAAGPEVASAPTRAAGPANVVTPPDAGAGAPGRAPAPAAAAPGAEPAGTEAAGGRPSGPAGGGVPIVATAPQSAAEPGDEPGPEAEPAAAASSSRARTAGGSADPVDRSTPDPRQPAVVKLVLPPGPFLVGQTIPVEVWIENAVDVASVPFHVQYNPRVLKLADERGERGPFLEVSGVSTQFMVAPGHTGRSAVVGLSLMGASQGVSGGGLLMTLQFEAVGTGTSPLTFTNASVRGTDASTRNATFESGSIDVAN
jgi:hypothetical protein